MTVRELKNLLERLEKMNLDYADAKVLFRTSNDMDEEFEFGMLDYFLNDAKDEGYDSESVVILG
jgi:hypothetical protein